MSPIEATVNTVTRALASFHPGSMPVLSRAHYRRELVAWMFLPIMLGAVEGGVVGVVAKNAFAGTVPDRWLNITVAILSGAPAFANITSFLWASLSHGRNKIRFLVGLQIAAALLVAHVAFAPHHWTGLLMLTAGAVGTRVCWSGVVTLRATVWRANYPRSVRASMAGKLATVQALVLAVVGLAVGFAMRANESSYHWLYPLVAAFGLIGAVVYGRMRMRGQAALIVQEQQDGDGGMRGSPLPFLRILRDDAPFRRYMLTMFVFGIGNLMVTAPLVIMLRDVFDYGYVRGILLTSTIPILLMPPSIPLWSRLLDRVHIVHFRVVHSWAFVAATAAFLVAAVTREPAFAFMLWVGAALKGIAIGGGVLGWNLGHHDFAPSALTSSYMGVHVTMTGLRGLIGPPLAVLIYELLEARGGHGGWVMAVCLALNLLGAAGFLRLHRSMQREAR